MAVRTDRCAMRRRPARICRVASACLRCGLQLAHGDGNRDQTEMETDIKARDCAWVERGPLNFMWLGRSAVCVAAPLGGVPFLRKTEMEAKTPRWFCCRQCDQTAKS